MRRISLLAALVVGVGCTGGGSSSGEPAPNPGSSSTPGPSETTPGENTPTTALKQEAPEESALAAADLALTWSRLNVPHAGRVIRTPDGYVAISHSMVSGGGKVISATHGNLYRSIDGVTWSHVALPAAGDVGTTAWSIAYGAGRYVVFKTNGVGQSDSWTSTDLATWTPVAVAGSWRDAKRLNGHFFAFSRPNDFVISDDGLTWRQVASPLLQANGLAFGNGKFLIAGFGAFRTSADTQSWDAVVPDCTTVGAQCSSTPSGEPFQGPYYNAVFFQDRFFVDQLSSADGATWTSYAGPIANVSVGGYLFNTTGEQVQNYDGKFKGLRAFKPGESVTTITVEDLVATFDPAVAPETIIAGPATGETCVDHRCVIVGDSFYLLH